MNLCFLQGPPQSTLSMQMHAQGRGTPNFLSLWQPDHFCDPSKPLELRLNLLLAHIRVAVGVQEALLGCQ